MYNNYTSIDNSYYEICLIKIVEIFILNFIFRIYISYQLEPRVYKVIIFIESLLKVICMRKTHLELKMTLYKAIYPLLADVLRIIHYKKKVDYIFHYFNPGWKSLRIQVKYITYEGFFLRFGKIIYSIMFLMFYNASFNSVA
jgi:hypothetical protein